MDQAVSIAVDSNYAPFIASYNKIGDPDPTMDEIELLYKDSGGSWTGGMILHYDIQVVDLVINPATNQPAISVDHSPPTIGALMIFTYDGANWTHYWGWATDNADSAFTYNPANNHPGVAFSQSGSLIFSEWYADETVDSITLGPALAYTSTGEPCIAYYNNNVLRYAPKSGTWNIVTVDAAAVETGDDQTIGLAIDGYDRPHIAYVAAGHWKYAYYDGATWNVETVGLPANALRADIVIAPDNNPYIVYQTGTDIYFAYRYSGQWILNWFAPGYMSMSNLRVDNMGALHMAMKTQPIIP